jgi:hypothetical protein
MIYDFADASKRDKFDRLLTPCERCKVSNLPWINARIPHTGT